MLRHERRLRGFLGRVAGEADGDELAQEALLRAWERAGDFRGTGSWFGWVAGIGWRLFLDRRRQEKRRADLRAAELQPEPVSPESGAAMDIARLFSHLSATERAAMTLVLGHGHSHGEAATILNLPVGTLKSLLLRGREKLHRLAQGGDGR